MSQIMIMIMSSINSMLFSSMNHPMNMGIVLLLQTLLMCVMTGFMSQTSWFSYILFLVFLGGMLVLFIYMTSIASNEMFKKNNYPLFILIMITLSIIFVITSLLDSFMIPINNSEDSTLQTMIYNDLNKMTLAPLYNSPMSNITIFMVLYLFLTLIVIVNITKFNKGPLRPVN